MNEKEKILNTPIKIYLQIGCKDSDCTIDFNELSAVTWSKDKINNDDIEYILYSYLNQYREALEEIVRLNDEKLSKNGTMRDCIRSSNELLTAINKAKQLLEGK